MKTKTWYVIEHLLWNNYWMPVGGPGGWPKTLKEATKRARMESKRMNKVCRILRISHKTIYIKP